MSKIVNQQYEYACYDDTTLTAVPPTYPAPTDSYQTEVVAAAASTYGTQTITGPGFIALPAIPAGATVIMLPAATNTTLVALECNTPLVPNGTSQSLAWPAGPGQIVTFPGVLNPGNLTVGAVTTTMSPSGSTAYSIQLLWYL